MSKKYLLLFVFLVTPLFYGCNSDDDSDSSSSVSEGSSTTTGSQDNNFLYIAEIADPNTPIALMVFDSNEDMLLVTGDKDQNGNLLTLDEITFWKQDIQQWASLRLDVNYQPISMTFSSGTKVEFSNYQNSMVDLTFFDAQGVQISQETAQLQVAENRSLIDPQRVSSQQRTDIPDISQEQEWFSTHPKTATLCKKRAEFINLPFA